MREIMVFIYSIIWITGIVLAHGFYSTLAAIFTFGIWSTYLVIELIFIRYGII